jgi:hypothetical protein
VGSLAIGANGFLERLTLRSKDKSVTCQNVFDGIADRFGEGAILFAKVEQRHAHGAKAWQFRSAVQASEHPLAAAAGSGGSFLGAYACAGAILSIDRTK